MNRFSKHLSWKIKRTHLLLLALFSLSCTDDLKKTARISCENKYCYLTLSSEKWLITHDLFSAFKGKKYIYNYVIKIPEKDIKYINVNKIVSKYGYKYKGFIKVDRLNKKAIVNVYYFDEEQGKYMPIEDFGVYDL